ncbi:hypothetical protein FRB99_004398 [Tulasnella sp. 403]|nr:hypothetical protein FRB99_004398 [Tulasnella sp. 403]
MQTGSRGRTLAELKALDSFERLCRLSQPSQPHEVRRKYIRECAELLPSQYPSVNKKVTTYLAETFPDFEDLQETIINAAYDMAEEPKPEVRYDGIKFIVTLSKRVASWARRNVDVLIQLFALEDPEDVQRLNDALETHMVLDPTSTLRVLCSYLDLSSNHSVSPTPELRSKILAFLVLCKTKDSHLKNANSTAAQEYRHAMLQALPKTSSTELKIIVDDLLLPFPQPNEFLESLMETVLDKALEMVTSGTSPTAEDITTVTETAYRIYTKLGSPAQTRLLLLAFYSSLQMLTAGWQYPPAEKIVFTERLAEAVDIKLEQVNPKDHTMFIACSGRIADACVQWTRVLLTCKDQLWKSSLPLLRTVLSRRQAEPNWKPDEAALQRIMDRITSPLLPQAVQVYTREARSIVKDILEPPKPRITQTLLPSTAPTTSTTEKVLPPAKRKSLPTTAEPGPSARPVPLINRTGPQLAAPFPLPAPRDIAQSQPPQSLLQRLSIAAPSPSSTKFESTSGSASPMDSTLDIDADRPAKKQKRNDDRKATPLSLLARMSNGADAQANTADITPQAKAPVLRPPVALAKAASSSAHGQTVTYVKPATPMGVQRPTSSTTQITSTSQNTLASQKNGQSAAPALSILGAAGSRATKLPESTTDTPKPSGLSIKGAAGARPGGGSLFSQAVAGLGKAPVSDASRPIEKLPSRPLLSKSGSSLLARLTDGDQPMDTGQSYTELDAAGDAGGARRKRWRS